MTVGVATGVITGVAVGVTTRITKGVATVFWDISGEKTLPLLVTPQFYPKNLSENQSIKVSNIIRMSHIQQKHIIHAFIIDT